MGRIFKRKLYDKLLEWKNTQNGKTALLVEGARRVFPHLINHQLQTVAAACGYHLDKHHHALADAEACAWIAREIL